ncbi:uncharacterized protein LOC144582118 isoform X2 [Callithrix jacchus]
MPGQRRLFVVDLHQALQRSSSCSMSSTERSSLRGGSESGNCALHASAKPTGSTMPLPASPAPPRCAPDPSQLRRGWLARPGPRRPAAPMPRAVANNARPLPGGSFLSHVFLMLNHFFPLETCIQAFHL